MAWHSRRKTRKLASFVPLSIIRPFLGIRGRWLHSPRSPASELGGHLHFFGTTFLTRRVWEHRRSSTTTLRGLKKLRKKIRRHEWWHKLRGWCWCPFCGLCHMNGVLLLRIWCAVVLIFQRIDSIKSTCTWHGFFFFLQLHANSN